MSTTSVAPQELQLLLDSLPQASFLLRRNSDGSIVFAHAHGRLARELRMTTDQVAGENPVQFFGSDLLRQQMIQAWSGQEGTINFRYKRRQLSCSLEPVLFGGEVTEVIGTLIDVTEQRKIERKLSLFAHTLSSLNEAVSITDSDDFLLYVNPAFCSLYGYSEEEVLNKLSSILWSDRNPKEVTEPILRDTLNGGWRGYLYNRNKNDEHFLIYLHTSAVRDEQGEVIGCVGVADRVECENITPGKLAEGSTVRVPDFSQARQQIEAMQLPPLGASSENGLMLSANTLRTSFSDAFILHKASDQANSTSLWLSRQLDMQLLALVEDHEPDEISSYRSLMVSGLLDQIVNHGLITMPDQILDKVHRLFAPFLALNYNVSGADPQINLGICQLSANKTTLRFAGANMNLFVSHADRIRFYPGDEHPIQRVQGEVTSRYFKVHAIPVQEANCVYIVSNSLTQVLGSPSNVAKAEQFIEIMYNSRSENMEQQQQRIQELIASAHQSTDNDLNFTVVGFRI